MKFFLFAFFFIIFTAPSDAMWNKTENFKPDPAIEANFQRQFMLDGAQANGKSRIEEAITHGTLDNLKALDVEGVYIPLQKSIYLANLAGNFPVFLWLQHRGAKVFKDATLNQDLSLFPSLEDALKSGNFELAAWWLEHPKIQQALSQNSEQQLKHYLYAAFASGNQKTIELVEHSIRLPQPQRSTLQPLPFLAKSGNLKLLKAYHQKGWPLPEDEKSKLNFFLSAVESGNLKLVKWVSEKTKVFELNPETSNYSSIIMLSAIASKNLALVKWLYSKNFSIESIYLARHTYHPAGASSIPSSKTFLGAALNNNSCDIASWFMDQGGKINNSEDASSWTLAYSTCNKEQQFMPHPTSLDIPCTAHLLINASYYRIADKNYTCIQHRIQKGYPTALQDDLNGHNLVFDAIQYEYLPLLKYLYYRQTPLLIKNNEGVSAIQYAKEYGNIEIINFLSGLQK